MKRSAPRASSRGRWGSPGYQPGPTGNLPVGTTAPQPIHGNIFAENPKLKNIFNKVN